MAGEIIKIIDGVLLRLMDHLKVPKNLCDSKVLSESPSSFEEHFMKDPFFNQVSTLVSSHSNQSSYSRSIASDEQQNLGDISLIDDDFAVADKEKLQYELSRIKESNILDLKNE